MKKENNEINVEELYQLTVICIGLGITLVLMKGGWLFQ